MATNLFRKITRKLAGELFSIMVDEITNVSNTEQLVFCLRYVDRQLNSHEPGIYNSSEYLLYNRRYPVETFTASGEL